MAALLFGAALSSGAAEAASGDLQVHAPVGTRVTVEGRAAETVGNGHGVTFDAVPEGPHIVRAVRAGHLPERAVVEVRAGQVTVHRFDTWAPPPPRAKGATGALVVQTVPTDVTVAIPSFGWPKLTKGDAPLVVPGVPAGRHRVTVCTEYKCIDYKADVPKGGLLSLRVRFDPGEVEEDTAAFETRLETRRQACAKTRDARACKLTCVASRQLGRPERGCPRPAVVADVPPDEPAPLPAGTARTVPGLEPDGAAER